MAADRMRQINELLRTELSTALLRDVELPENAVVSITQVHTSPDLHHATVLVSILPDQLTGTILAQLRRELPHIMKELGPRLVLRNIPKMHLKLDETERSAARIEAILDSIKKNQ